MLVLECSHQVFFSQPLFFQQSRDCAQLGPPPQGEVVQVRWTDGLVYGAKFVATHAIHMYLVRIVIFFVCNTLAH